MRRRIQQRPLERPRWTHDVTNYDRLLDTGDQLHLYSDRRIGCGPEIGAIERINNVSRVRCTTDRPMTVTGWICFALHPPTAMYIDEKGRDRH